MPNFSYTVGKTWTPYTFDEILKPLVMYTEEYNKQEEALSELATKAGVWENMINPQTDSHAYKMYKQFSNELEDYADQLAKKGLNATNRKRILNMRTRYNKEITPIEQAYKRRQQLIDEQRKALMANPSLMYDVDFSMTSLDDLISNPNLSYTPVSGDDLYKKGKEAAISSSSRLLEVMPALQGQYWKIRQGYGADAANKFLVDQANIPELNQAIDRIVSQSRVTSANKSRATDYVISGIMSGMSYDEKYQANRGYIDQAERERLNLAREQFEWTKDKWEDEQLGIKLPNGDRVKDVGGGRVRITHPDGRVEIMAAPKANSENVAGVNKKGQPFSGLQFKMWNNSSATNSFQEGLSNEKWTTKRSGFDTGDEKLIKLTDLSFAMQTNILGKLAEYNKTPDDIEIYVDEDPFSDNHYQIRLKQNKKEPEKVKPIKKVKTTTATSSAKQDSTATPKANRGL